MPVGDSMRLLQWEACTAIHLFRCCRGWHGATALIAEGIIADHAGLCWHAVEAGLRVQGCGYVACGTCGAWGPQGTQPSRPQPCPKTSPIRTPTLQRQRHRLLLSQPTSAVAPALAPARSCAFPACAQARRLRRSTSPAWIHFRELVDCAREFLFLLGGSLAAASSTRSNFPICGASCAGGLELACTSALSQCPAACCWS